MERAEAIQELQNCKGLIQQDGQDYLDERDIPLLDMAIEALQADAEPIVIRAKALMRKEDFDKWAEDIKKQNQNIVCIPCDAEVVSADAVHIHEDGTLEFKVPNAQKVGRVLVMDTDSHIGGGLFYPDDAVHDGCDGCRYEQNTEHEYPCKDCKQNYMDMWERKPNDSVSVVRCKDCRWYEPKYKDKEYDCPQGLYAVYADDYCSHGERREP